MSPDGLKTGFILSSAFFPSFIEANALWEQEKMKHDRANMKPSTAMHNQCTTRSLCPILQENYKGEPPDW